MNEIAEIPCLLPASVFNRVERLCRIALDYSGNHQQVREAISSLHLTLNAQSERELGTPSVDARMLSGLLKRTNPNPDAKERQNPQDPIEYLLTAHLITKDHLAASLTIRQVWDAFSRFLVMSARSYQRGGAKKVKGAKPLSPMDVMSNDTYVLWREHYTPWYTEASKKLISSNTGKPTNEGAITLQIVVDGHQPKQVDFSRALDRGMSLRILRRQLDLFNRV